jgi:hypothetical protein
MEISNKTKSILNFFGLILAVGVLTFLIPQSVGLGAGGFDSSQTLQQFSFYLAGGIFLFLLIVGFVIELIMRKGDEKYGNSVGFASLGEYPHVPFFKRFSQFQFFFLCIILFSILGVFIFVTKQNTFTGITSLEQQFTPAGELLFSSLLIPGAENLGLALVLLTGFIVIRLFARKGNWSRATFGIFCWVLLPLMGGFYWIINHLLRYGGQDIQLTVVFMFGLFMSLLTMLTGSFIPGWIMHASNNVFYDLQRLFSQQNILFIVIGVIFVLIVLYFFIYRKRLLGRKKNETVI